MEEWKKVQFKDLYYKISEKNVDFGKDRIISVANMYYNSNAKITDDEYLKTYNIFRVGDIAFEGHKSKNFAYGRFVENTIGDGIVSHIFDVFRPLTNLNFLYWKYAINYENIMGRILKKCTKSATMMNNLVADDFLKEFISIPPIEEQEKIAEILSTQDKLIELKQKLIDQKKQQKKWLMQNLLTGRIRLKGFEGEWKFLKSGEIFSNVSDKKHDGNSEVLSATQDKGIIPRSCIDIDIKYDKANTVNYKKVCKGNFVISLRSFQGGIEYSEYNGIISPAYTVLSAKKEICNIYYKEFFKSEEYIKRLNIAVYGIRDGKNISYDDFSMIYIPFPPIEEQTAIAEILSAQDKEIELLEKQLEQEKLKKKALMQLLLTGKVRVI